MIAPRDLGNSTASSAFAIANRLSKLDGIVGLVGKHILDIGCNDAAYTVALAQSAQLTVGIDIEPDRLGRAAQRIRGQVAPVGLSYMSAERQAFCNNAFDIIFINEVLEHIPDQESALDEIHRVLKHDGQFALFAPNRLYPFETHGVRIGDRQFGRFVPLIHWLPRFIGRHYMNARSYTAHELKNLLASHGFTVVHLSCLFPPFDGLRDRLQRYHLASIVDAYRKLISLIGRLPLLGAMGLSIFVVAVKSEQAARRLVE